MEKVLSVRELKERAIKEFKERFKLEKLQAVKTIQDGEECYGRIDYFSYDENKDEPFAYVQYEFEYGFRELGIKHRFYAEDFEKKKIEKVNEKELGRCIHYYEFERYTGDTRKALTLGGVVEEETKLYRCRFCGDTKIY
ncbi:hypothetical protein DRN69_00010 [Candidatus Pacearchaeota archaeon]|nr:MAG: hypothetical protein DRN69_00010 [Candidatus Pacearchaeota archaeon]